MPRERTLVEVFRAVALRPAVPLLAVVLVPERTARVGRRVRETRFAAVRVGRRVLATRFAAVREPARVGRRVRETRFAVTRLPAFRAVFFAATRAFSLRRADFAWRFFLNPPPVTLFTVAQARASAVFSDVPRFS